ncbi:hypothetical protein NLX67_14990 [Domibacillus sp. A3M-37]|uniref:hypothetical protein n=1 Tax=Domibacillus sp. A3M-37 TaxID=2962037 RepID=UPI0020B7063F|nr:hypothetical protein [Domibacillus sp. A3M-37]MCP3763680.1 hypothetical protein [Domibacillus sp. A3M-37]
MPNKSKQNFRSKLVENARSQANNSWTAKGSSSLKSSILNSSSLAGSMLVEEKQTKIEQNVEKLRRKHAKVLSQ